VRRNLAAPADRTVFLDFDERPDPGSRTDGTAVDVDQIGMGNNDIVGYGA
jgi:hypothetical protein